MFALDNFWEKITPKGNFIPDPRSGHACVIFQSIYLYIFGGYKDHEALNDLVKFNLQSLIWEKVEISNKETETPASYSIKYFIKYI